MALTTREKVKSHLGITGATDDVLINQLIDEVSAGVELYCGRTFESATYTEYLDGTGTAEIYLEQRPVTAITTVHVDSGGMAGHASDAFDDESEWDIGVDFFPRRLDETERNRGLLRSFRQPWHEGYANIKVVYVAGYSVIPEDLELAVHSMIAKLRQERKAGAPLQSETLGKYSYTILSNSKAAAQDVTTAANILNRYRVLDF